MYILENELQRAVADLIHVHLVGAVRRAQEGLGHEPFAIESNRAAVPGSWKVADEAGTGLGWSRARTGLIVDEVAQVGAA